METLSGSKPRLFFVGLFVMGLFCNGPLYFTQVRRTSSVRCEIRQPLRFGLQGRGNLEVCRDQSYLSPMYRPMFPPWQTSSNITPLLLNARTA